VCSLHQAERWSRRPRGRQLESLQIDPMSGQYVTEMSGEEQGEFWQRSVGDPPRAFVGEALTVVNRFRD
jgi:hypothetical protein